MTRPPTTDLPVTLDDVTAAGERIRGAVVRTPSAVSETLSEILGCTVVVKFETLQFTAAYKERGARNRLLELTPEQAAAGVVAVSAGNHAQAVARHAALLGIEATIVMPTSTPFVKVARTRHLGATVELVGEDLADAMRRGHELESAGATLIHPFDDPAIIAGAGTVAIELLGDHPDVECLVVPVGGGGLIAGMAVVAASHPSSVEVIGVQTESWPGMANAVDGGDRPVGGPTMAEGIAVAEPGGITTRIVRELVDDVVVVSERAIEDAVSLVVDIEKVVVEGAGAAGIAALAEQRDRFAGRTVGVVLTGANIDPWALASIIQRGLVHNGRLVRLRVALPDRPGSLAAVLQAVAAAGANVVDVIHQRLFAEIALRSAEVDLVIECMDTDHRDRVLDAVAQAGQQVRLLPLDVT